MATTDRIVTVGLKRVAEEVDDGEVRTRIGAVIRSIAAIFGFLRDIGYEIKDIDISSTELHAYRVACIWRSDEAGREVSIRYLPYNFKGQESHTFAVSIINLSRLDEGSRSKLDVSKDYMSLEMYLESKYRDFNSGVLEVSTYEGPFIERVEKVLQAYAYFMQDGADDVLRGEYWESGHFHRRS